MFSEAKWNQFSSRWICSDNNKKLFKWVTVLKSNQALWDSPPQHLEQFHFLFPSASVPRCEELLETVLWISMRHISLRDAIWEKKRQLPPNCGTVKGSCWLNRCRLPAIRRETRTPQWDDALIKHTYLKIWVIPKNKKHICLSISPVNNGNLGLRWDNLSYLAMGAFPQAWHLRERRERMRAGWKAMDLPREPALCWQQLALISYFTFR